MTVQAYNMKVIVSGGVFEFFKYEDTMFRGYEQKRSTLSKNSFYDSEGNAINIDPCTGEIVLKKMESRGRSNIRARNELRRLALANFSNKSKFITLTFRDHIDDVSEANKVFKAFIRRLHKMKDDLKYIAVVEFTKAGRIHYHLLCDLKYTPAKKIEEMWGQGFIKINRIDHVDNIGAYVIKYMTKADADSRLIKKKLYQTSKNNLIRPKELVGQQAEFLYQKMMKEKRKMVYSSSYENKQTTNKIIYEEYNLNRK